MLRGTVAAALVCVLAGVAHADNKEVAKESYSEGKRHYDLGEYDAALNAFKKAYLNYEEPVFLFNIAQCYRALGDRPAAVRSYRAFLRNWPKAPNREQVERIIAELEQPAQTTPPPTATATAPPARPEAKPVATATPAAPPPATAPGTAVASSEHPSPPPPPAATSEPKPAPAANPVPAANPASPPKHDELVGMVEIEPNFDRPSGSVKPVKWWAWTLIALAVGGVVAASVAIGVTQSASKFDNTLPQFNVNNSALRAATVRF
ncbi:MAG TPA: tetratricopeptide repeat protein [Polyangia bacterium]